MLVALLYTGGQNEAPFEIHSPAMIRFVEDPAYPYPVAFVTVQDATACMKAFPESFEVEKFATQRQLDALSARVEALEQAAKKPAKAKE